MAVAWPVSDRSGRVIDRDTNHVTRIATPTDTTARTMNHIRVRSAAAFRSSARSTRTSSTRDRKPYQPEF